MWRQVVVKARIGRGESHLFAGYADINTGEVFEVSRFVTACGILRDRPRMLGKSRMHWTTAVTCPECQAAALRAGLAVDRTPARRGEAPTPPASTEVVSERKPNGTRPCGSPINVLIRSLRVPEVHGAGGLA